MNLVNFKHPKSSRTRLALTYLAIIMVLSAGFSIIFYQSSTANLQFDVLQTTSGVIDVSSGTTQPTTSTGGSIVSDNVTIPTGAATPADVEIINSQIQKQIESIRYQVIQGLVIFNILALFVGGAVSYALARLTLKPIEAAMEAQDRFTSDASHELRTPLAVMQTEIEVTLKKSDLSLERAVAALRSVYGEVGRVKQLTEGLLDLSHEPNTIKKLVKTSLDSIITDSINAVLGVAQTKLISVTTDNIPNISINIEPHSFTRALVVLLDNAIKFSPKKSTIYLEAKTEGKYVNIQVRDEGPGIRATDLPHIFDRFYRADSSRSGRSTKGYGLGLSIAKNIIEQHGGTLTAVSQVGHGATFIIKIAN